jgi:hypothetical protein
MSEIEVSSWILELIDVGDATIRKVIGFLTHGMGNQRAYINQAEKQAGLRTYAAQQLSKDPDDRFRYMRMAAATIKYGAGACHEIAALTYCVLRETVDSSIPVCYVTCDHCEHAFVTLGIIGVHPDDEVIVVDAWPMRAQAVRWTDHFCRPYKLEIRTVKFGAGKPRISRLMSKHYASVDPAVEVARLQKQIDSGELDLVAAVYDLQWCSATKERITYKRRSSNG